jgi:hypothetical protein
MQQKRKSSLARLKAAKAAHQEEQGTSSLPSEEVRAQITNLTRMIADTEAAIVKGGR